MRARRRSGEQGFGIIELIIVLVIVAILMSVAISQLGTTRSKVSAPEMNVAAGAIWRGIQNYRIDNGYLPPVATLTSQHTQSPPGRTFADVGGGRYIQRWPSNPQGGPMQVYAGGSAMPTANDPSRAGQIHYYAGGGSVAGRPLRGYVVAYSGTGNIVYRRVIGTTSPATPQQGPAG